MKHHIGIILMLYYKMETTEEIVGYLTEWCRNRIKHTPLKYGDLIALAGEWYEWLEPDDMVEVLSFSEE